MQKGVWLSIIVLAQFVLGEATGAWAASNITWRVTDSAGVQKCNGTGSPSQVLIKTDPCNNISILDGTAGAARITATDGGADVLTLQFTKIRANADITGWHLIFEREFDAGPTGGSWWYKTWIIGNLNNSDSSNAISVTAKMYNPLGTQNTSSTLSVVASESQPFNKWHGPQVNPALNNQARKITVDLTMTLKQNHTVDFGYAGAFIQVRAQNTPPDECDASGTCPHTPDNALLKEFLQSLSEAREACLGVQFADSGCVGVHMVK